MNNIYWVIKGFVETEKSYANQGISKYTFFVDPVATKVDVRNAVETFYGVKVTSVNTQQVRKKTRLIWRWKVYTKRQAWVKALVTLKAGDKIDFTAFNTKDKKEEKTSKK